MINQFFTSNDSLRRMTNDAEALETPFPLPNPRKAARWSDDDIAPLLEALRAAECELTYAGWGQTHPQGVKMARDLCRAALQTQKEKETKQ